MTNFNPTPIKSLTVIALSGLMLAGVSSTAVFSQDSNVVVSPAAAEAVQSRVDYEGEAISVDANEIELSSNPSASSLDERQAEAYDEMAPAIELSSTENARLSLGVLSDGTDTADGLTRRDPYAIENIEVDPIYPEGIYVDEMRATAGIGLSSEF